MSGFPAIEPGAFTQLVIVHMDDSQSEIEFTDEHWQHTTEGIVVNRRGGRTTFPWLNIKSFTVVYSDETDETVTPIHRCTTTEEAPS